MVEWPSNLAEQGCSNITNRTRQGLAYRPLRGNRLPLLVERVGLNAANVVGLHLMEGIHQLLQLLLEAAAYAAELVPLPNLASAAALQHRFVTVSLSNSCVIVLTPMGMLAAQQYSCSRQLLHRGWDVAMSCCWTT